MTRRSSSAAVGTGRGREQRAPARGAAPAGGMPPPGEAPSALLPRARVPDVARRAGVSTATVDRVLNRRGAVRPVTAQRVLVAAAELGYLPDRALLAALAPEPMQLAFVLPAGTNRYLRMLGDTVEFLRDQWRHFNVRCRVEFVEGFDPQVLSAALLRLARRMDGIAFMALDHPLVREAVATLAGRGVSTVTLISDLSHSARAAYVGLDNHAAGRTAASLLGRFIGRRRAKVAMIAGSLSYRAHVEREAGFLSLFAESWPGIEVVGLREGRDDEVRNRQQTRVLLGQHPDLAGIYNIGGGADGIAQALKEARRGADVVLIGHGLTPDTRALLIDGTMDAVLTQAPQSVVLHCLQIFTNLREGMEALAGVEANRISIIVRENLP